MDLSEVNALRNDYIELYEKFILSGQNQDDSKLQTLVLLSFKFRKKSILSEIEIADTIPILNSIIFSSMN